MMELNQSTLRGILAAITSVDERFIVPKQGNWWNPQDRRGKPDTWCAYAIRGNRPRTLPYYLEEKEGTNSVVVEKIATIDLQFVGPQAEAMAQSVSAWPLRSDVQQQFKNVRGAIMNDTYEARSSNFYQDGMNGVMAWNVTIKVLWNHVIDTDQTAIRTIETGGKING